MIPPTSRAVRHYPAGTPHFPSICPSLVYIADMYGIYKSNVPLMIKKTSFEVKHCKIETVVLSRSPQAAKLKKTYIWNTMISGIRLQLLERGQES